MIVVRSAVLLAVVQIVAVTAASAIDLTGKWRFERGPSVVEFVDIVQSGTTVETSFVPHPFFPDPMTGTFDELTRVLSLQLPGCTLPSCVGDIQALVLPNGNWFDGRLRAGFPPSIGSSRTLASRCECFDGNLSDGDGCDAQCRIEPCFDCAGMPSVCTPTADGGACHDGSDCTAGETCSAGACGGGTTAPACIDMTGLWDVHSEGGIFYGEYVYRIEQRDGVVLFRTLPTGLAGGLGTIDTATGAFVLTEPPLFFLCVGVDTTTGTAAADGMTYSAAGTRSVGAPNQCVGMPFTNAGTRRTCGDGERDCSEQCDDGNVVSGDGCDANCHVSGCGSGVVTAGEICDDGNAASGDGCAADCTIEPCWACEGDQPSVCAARLQTSCVKPRQPHRAALHLRHSAAGARDLVAARSDKTETLGGVLYLGDPLATTDYQVCVFDRSGPTPQVLFGATVPAGGTCGERPCWRAVPDGFVYRNRAAAPHGIARLLVGDDGSDGRALVIGRGAGLDGAPSGVPPLPLAVPLELQIQKAGTGAGCFAIEIPADGVIRNDPATGRFDARGAP